MTVCYAEMIPNASRSLLRDRDLNCEINCAGCTSNACRQGVHRTHIISYAKDGALLEGSSP